MAWQINLKVILGMVVGGGYPWCTISGFARLLETAPDDPELQKARRKLSKGPLHILDKWIRLDIG